jgi:hypothetical protein
MWTSVPQIVVSVTRMTASPVPASGVQLVHADVAGAVEDRRAHRFCRAKLREFLWCSDCHFQLLC